MQLVFGCWSEPRKHTGKMNLEGIFGEKGQLTHRLKGYELRPIDPDAGGTEESSPFWTRGCRPAAAAEPFSVPSPSVPRPLRWSR